MRRDSESAAPLGVVGGFQLLARSRTTPASTWYRARNQGRGSYCELELFEPNHVGRPGFQRWFRAEAGAAARFRHPEAIRTIALERNGKGAFVAYARHGGRHLGEVIEQARVRGTDIPVELALHIAITVSGVLRSLEQTPIDGRLGMLHGSLTPEDVWILPAGGIRVARVGLARARLELPASASEAAHRAPELLEDRAALRPACDVYALGLLLFEMLIGRTVYERSSAPETQQAVRSGTRPRLVKARSDVRADLEALVEWMLAENPLERPQTMATVASMMVDALSRIRGNGVGGAELAAFVARTGDAAVWPGGIAEVAAPFIETEERTDALALLPPPAHPAPEEEPEILFEAPVDFEGPGLARSDWGPTTNIKDGPEADALALSQRLYDVFAIEREVSSPGSGRYVAHAGLGGGHLELGTDEVSGRSVLMEPLPPHLPDALERRLEELHRVAPHPNLLPLLETRGGAHGAPRAISVYDGGLPLSDIVDARGPIELKAAEELLAGLVAALESLHTAGVSHGALHPECVLVERVEGKTRVCLGGLLQSVGDPKLADPAFTPPEQLYGEGRRDVAGDVWGLGAVLFYALTGERPYAAQSRDMVLETNWFTTVPRIVRIRPAGQGFDPVIQAALDPRPGHRPVRVRDLLGRLHDAVPRVAPRRKARSES